MELLGFVLFFVELGYLLWLLVINPSEEAQTPVEGHAIIEDRIEGDRPNISSLQ